VNKHPGGLLMMTRNAGLDVTAVFNRVGHSARARAMLADMYVGDLVLTGQTDPTGPFLFPCCSTSSGVCICVTCAHIHTYPRGPCVCVCVRACVRAGGRACGKRARSVVLRVRAPETHTHTHTHTHTQAHTHTHTHMHTHTCTHTHMHTHTQARTNTLSLAHTHMAAPRPQAQTASVVNSASRTLAPPP
jgi:hypothetical protein